MNTGMGGDGGGGIYHSVYDSFYWYTKFSDGTFEYGRGLSQVNGTIVMRMADADILPFEFTNLAETVSHYADELEKLAAKSNAPKPVNFVSLKAAVTSLTESAKR